MRNTVRLGISSPELMANDGSSWILRRQQIKCERWSGLGEQVKVITAPSGFARGLLTYRDFHLFDDEGQCLASAVTEWVLLDMDTHRLRPIPPHIAALETDLAPAAAHLDRPSGKLTAPVDPTHRRRSTVHFYQLDFNDHLTNPVFPELMLEPLGLDFLSANLPATVDISFLREARYGDEIEATSHRDDLASHHALLRGETVLATMQATWQPLP